MKSELKEEQPTKRKVNVIATKYDIPVLDMLSLYVDIENVYDPKEYCIKLREALAIGEKLNNLPDIMIFSESLPDEEFNIDWKKLSIEEYKKSGRLSYYLREIYFRIKEMTYTPPIKIGFKNGALLLAQLNNANLLYDISNHYGTHHLTSFCMPDGNTIDFEVNSNHRHLILPAKNNKVFEILAFSTYNNSQSYTPQDGNVFKAVRDFIEIEGIHYPKSHSFCFMYDVPTQNESMLIDLTLQLLNT